MVKKILEKITNNTGLKLLSFFIAFFLWMVVVNVNNPATSTTFTTNVIIKNDEIITGNGMVYEILDESDTVKFTVSGPRNIIEGLSSSDFQVVADMTKINEQLGLVPIDVTPLRYSNKVTVTVKDPNLKVSIENVETAQFAVTATAQGTPKDGYAVGEVLSNPSTVTIKGPKSVLSRISKVSAEIQVDGIHGETTQTVIPVILDGNGDVISSSGITVSPSNVQVTASVLETKEIPVTVEDIDNVKDGYTLLSIKCLPEKILVKGEREALEELSSITIPAREVNLGNQTGQIEKSVSILSYLPEGVQLVDEDQSTVIVKAVVEKLSTKTFQIPVADISIVNLSNLYEVKFQQSTVSITLAGDAKELDKIKASDLGAYIDLKDYSEGSFSVTVLRKKIDGIVDSSVAQISGEIVKKGVDTETDGD